MNLVTTATFLVCLWAVTDVLSPLLSGASLPRAVGRLGALGLLSLLAFAVCSLGFTPASQLRIVEELSLRPTLALWIYALGAIGLWHAQRRAALCPTQPRDRVGQLGCAACVLLAAWSCLPPNRIDETLYHLALPAQYLRAGGFTGVPGHGNSGFPALGEMLFFWCLSAGALSAARAIQILVLAMGIDACMALLPSARRPLLLAATFFVLTPVVLWELPCAYVDVIEAVFEVTSLVLLAYWAQHNNNRALLVAGWLTGCAAGCKYLALAQIPFFFLAALLVVRARMLTAVPSTSPTPAAPPIARSTVEGRAPAAPPVDPSPIEGRGTTPPPIALSPVEGRVYLGATSLPHVFLACALSCVPVLPWLLRNIQTFGNPFFPFAADSFPSAQKLLPAQMQVLDMFMAQHGPLAPNGQPLYGLAALLNFPKAFFTEAAFSSPSFDGVMGWLPVLCIAALFAACRFAAPQTRALPPLLHRLLWSYILLRAAIWLSTSWQMRFLIGPALALCILCALYLACLPRRWGRVSALAIIGISLAGLYAQRQHAPRLSLDALQTPAASHALRLDYDPASALCDRAIAEHASRVMLVWTQREALWCDVPLYADSYDEGASMAAWLTKGAPDALQALRDHGISHILIDEDAFTRIPQGLEAEEIARLELRGRSYAELRAHALRQLDKVGHVALLQVAPANTL